MALLSVFFAQAFFSLSNVLQKKLLKDGTFTWANLIDYRLWLTLVPSAVGFALLMYALSKMDLSKAIITLGVCAVLFAAASGIFLFGEKLAWYNWAGILFAAGAIVLVNLK